MKFSIFNFQFSRQERGFTLLMAVLVSGVLLALGFAIYNVASKELILSSTGRESQFSFYAADSGVECALYWDRKGNAFSPNASATSVTCGGTENTFDIQNYDSLTHTATTHFSFSLGSTVASPCASVTVVRTTAPTTTKIESLGYNTCDTENPRRLERAIRVQY